MDNSSKIIFNPPESEILSITATWYLPGVPREEKYKSQYEFTAVVCSKCKQKVIDNIRSKNTGNSIEYIFRVKQGIQKIEPLIINIRDLSLESINSILSEHEYTEIFCISGEDIYGDRECCFCLDWLLPKKLFLNGEHGGETKIKIKKEKDELYVYILSNGNFTGEKNNLLSYSIDRNIKTIAFKNIIKSLECYCKREKF